MAQGSRIVWGGIVVAVTGLLATGAGFELAHAQTKVSEFGRYEGYAKPLYHQYVRESLYVPVRDGTELAVDVFRPAIRGEPVETPLPALFIYSRYWRAYRLPDGSIKTNLGVLPPGQRVGSLVARDDSGRLLSWETGRESMAELILHGYVYVRADARGSGASAGVRPGEMSRLEARDGADLVEWIAAQPWCDGRVGMIGGSYRAVTQLFLAAEAPPALKAIFPAVPPFDTFRFALAGTGLLRKAVFRWTRGQDDRDALGAGRQGGSVDAVLRELVPVDADPEGRRLAKIVAARRAAAADTGTASMLGLLAPESGPALRGLAEALALPSPVGVLPVLLDTPRLLEALRSRPALQESLARGLRVYRDAVPFLVGRQESGPNSLHTHLDAINASGIPTYVWSGWYDWDVVGAALLYANLRVPRRLTVGAWSHGPNEDNARGDNPIESEARELLTLEARRWFDYWLKGIPNGIMDGAPVRYAILMDGQRRVWRTASAWPPPDAGRVTLWLAEGSSGSIASLNDGRLSDSLPPAGEVTFRVDYTVTTGNRTRYFDAVGGGPIFYPDMVAHGESSLTFTTPPLEGDLLVVGHPIVSLHARSTSPDGELDVYLQEVDRRGHATYLTDGVLKASHRVEASPPYAASLGLPHSSSHREAVESVAPFDRGWALLRFDLQPTANLFEAGHRIRITVTGADAGDHVTVPMLPEPAVTLHLGGERASTIELPVLPLAGSQLR